MFQRLKTQFEYHDAVLVHFEQLPEDDLRLTFQLSAVVNGGSQYTSSLTFIRVRNFDAVDAQLARIAANQTHDRYLADVVAVRKESKNRFLVDTSQGPLNIEAANWAEV